jgi:hypothetical protein
MARRCSPRRPPGRAELDERADARYSSILGEHFRRAKGHGNRVRIYGTPTPEVLDDLRGEGAQPRQEPDGTWTFLNYPRSRGILRAWWERKRQGGGS